MERQTISNGSKVMVEGSCGIAVVYCYSDTAGVGTCSVTSWPIQMVMKKCTNDIADCWLVIDVVLRR